MNVLKTYATLLLVVIVILCNLCDGLSQSIKNYEFSNQGTGTAYAGIAGTNIFGIKKDDHLSTAINIGFDFWYMGVRYTTVNVSTNGWLNLGSATTTGAGAPSVSANNLTSSRSDGLPILAPLWDDMTMDADNLVTCLTAGQFGERVFTVEWELMDYVGSVGFGSVVSYEVKLYEADGKIEFHYRQESKSPVSPSSSIGITAAGTGVLSFLGIDNATPAATDTSTGTAGNLEVATIAARPTTNSIFRFSPVNSATAPSALTATTSSSTQVNLTWVDNSSNELGFAVYYSKLEDVPLDGTNSAYFSTTAANATSISVTGLSPCTKYYFKVVAVKENYTVSTNIANATTSSSGGGTKYYVNDGTLDGNDIYTTAIGAVGNTGTAKNSPKREIAQIISGFALTDGDTVFVDAGTYSNGAGIVLTNTDDGSNGCGVVFTGVDSSKSIIDPAGIGSHVWNFQGSAYVTLKKFKMMGNLPNNNDIIQFDDFANNITVSNCWLINEGGGAESCIDTDQNDAATSITIKNCYLDGATGDAIAIDGSSTCKHTNWQLLDNTITASGAGISIDEGENIFIKRNRFAGTGTGINTTSSGSFAQSVKIYNNYFYSAKGFLGSSTVTSGKLYHNSFYNSANCVEFASTSNSGWSVKNNIFYTTSAVAANYCLKVAGSTKFDKIDCNLYYHPNGATCVSFNATDRTLAIWKDGTTVDHSNESGQFGDESSIGGTAAANDPKYVTPGTGDLDLQSGSPAFDAGCAVSEVLDDIAQSTRGSSVTIGAYDESTFLPVKLTSFQAVCNKGNVQLKWQTASETGNDKFVILHSLNGEEYTAAGEVKGAGTSSQSHDYSFIHNTTSVGNSYYKMRQIDFDGKYSDSKVVMIDSRCNNLNFSAEEVYYNSATNTLNVTLNSLTAEKGYLNLVDITGRLEYTTGFSISKELSQYEFTLGAIASGSYLIVLSDDLGGSYTRKIIIIR